MQEAVGGTISELTPTTKALLADAAKKRTSQRRGAFMAKAAADLFGGNARRAESCFGWKRHTVELGLCEQASGLVCLDHFQARGNKKRAAKRPDLERDMRALADPHSQADPPFKSLLSYPRLSAASVRRALLEEKGWKEEALPAPRTMNTILNGLGERLRSVAKTRPEKKRATAQPFSRISERSTPRRTRTPRAGA